MQTLTKEKNSKHWDEFVADARRSGFVRTWYVSDDGRLMKPSPAGRIGSFEVLMRTNRIERVKYVTDLTEESCTVLTEAARL